METKISLLILQDDVHNALKSWHRIDTDASLFDYLQLFRQVRLEDASNTRQATNKILLDALKVLEVDYEVEARLLRKHFLDGLVMRAVANQLNISEATAYRKQQEAIKQLALILQAKESRARDERRTMLEKRLEPLSYVQLIGVEDHLRSLLNLLTSPEPPWLVSVEGLGGIGKTSLADALSRRVISNGIFDDFGWISAKQHIFSPGGGIKPVDMPALTAEDLVDKLAAQLMPDISRPGTFSVQDALAALRARLKQNPHLVVIDNLETVLDIESLLPTLRNLANPTKFLLTSRESLTYEPDIYHFGLSELSEANALSLLRHEAHLHNLPHLEEASDDDLGKIFEVVGGNPLALRLVVGQTHVHTLNEILADLAGAQGQKVEMLYTFIYRRAWDNLDELARQVFLAMPLVANQGGSLEYLADLSDLDPAKLRDVLDRLVTLNLVDSKGDLTKRRYTIHNLTRTFLQEQVAKWQ